jgi:hypothetical protein
MSDENKPFDPFELAAAIVLGLSAVGASIAGHQAGLWGGQSVEGYGESAAMTTKASTTYNDELTSYIQDAQTDVRAKELLWEAYEIDDEARASRLKEMATWLYTSQLTDHAYDALGLPAVPEGEDPDEFTMPPEALEKAFNTDLDDDYVDAVFEPSSKEFEAAEKRFDVGRKANEIGDQFSLAGVILTVALFFGGLALVFKTSMRWAFLGAGTLVLIGGSVFMGTLTWA